MLIDKTDPTLICSYKPPSNYPIPLTITTATVGASDQTALDDHLSPQPPPPPGAINPTSPLHLLCKNKEEKLELVAQALGKLKYESTSTRNLVEYALQKEDLTRQTIAHLAIANNHARILEMLFGKFELNREIREGKMGNYLIHTAAKNGSTKILELLEKYDAMSFRTNTNKENALHIAAEYNSSGFIRQFLQFEDELVNNPESERFLRCMCVCDKDQPPVVSQLRSTTSSGVSNNSINNNSNNNNNTTPMTPLITSPQSSNTVVTGQQRPAFSHTASLAVCSSSSLLVSPVLSNSSTTDVQVVFVIR